MGWGLLRKSKLSAVYTVLVGPSVIHLVYAELCKIAFIHVSADLAEAHYPISHAVPSLTIFVLEIEPIASML